MLGPKQDSIASKSPLAACPAAECHCRMTHEGTHPTSTFRCPIGLTKPVDPQGSSMNEPELRKKQWDARR
jgi:hypothetical protein